MVLLPILLQAVAPPPVKPTVPEREQWTTLAPLPWKSPPLLTPDVTAYVLTEVKAGRCQQAHGPLSVELVAQVSDGGDVLSVVPHPIGCPTVEQYAAGLVSGFARNNLREVSTGWYRVTVTFTLPA